MNNLYHMNKNTAIPRDECCLTYAPRNWTDSRDLASHQPKAIGNWPRGSGVCTSSKTTTLPTTLEASTFDADQRSCFSRFVVVCYEPLAVSALEYDGCQALLSIACSCDTITMVFSDFEICMDDMRCWCICWKNSIRVQMLWTKRLRDIKPILLS